MFRDLGFLVNSSVRRVLQSRASEEMLKVSSEESPAKREQGRHHHRSGPESAKEERQGPIDISRGSTTESASTRVNAKGR